MTLAVAALKAVHDALAGSSTATEQALYAFIGGRVYDKVPGPQPTYPYLTVEIDIRDDATTCAKSREVHATVHVWSAKNENGADYGTKQARSIGGLVDEILAPLDSDEAPQIEGFAVNSADLDVEIYRDGGNPLLTEGVLTFTYLVDPES